MNGASGGDPDDIVDDRRADQHPKGVLASLLKQVAREFIPWRPPGHPATYPEEHLPPGEPASGPLSLHSGGPPMARFVVPGETVFGWGCAAEVGPRAAGAG